MNEDKKRKILVFCIALSALPIFLIIRLPSIITVASVELWAADIFGYLGLVMLLWMFALGAKSIMGLLFHDLAHVLHIHKWLGKYGSLAIMLHPVLATLSYGESLLYPFLPKLSTAFERSVTLGRIAFILLLFTWGISWFVRKKMPFRFWKYLHFLAYISIPFAFLHTPHVGSNYGHHELVRAYFYGLLLSYILLFILRLRGFLNLDKSIYTIVRHTQLTNTDYVLNLKLESGKQIVPRRGQYIYLKLGLLSEDHPFSVLQYDKNTGNIVVGYRIYGSYTRLMCKLPIGTRVYIGGPYGSFMADIDTTERPLVFLTGGIGITPFVDQILQLAGKREQWLFAANRSHESAVLIPEVSRALGSHLINVYSEQRTNLRPQDTTGRITVDLLKKYLGEDLNKYEFYFCGPPAMMKSLYAVMNDSGVSTDHWHAEKFGW